MDILPGFTPIEDARNAAALTGSQTGAGSSVLGKEEFLKLLITQLSNQDPLNPMEGQEFAAQLAQFTSVEQLMNIERTLALNSEVNSLLAQSMNSGVASGLIGKTVEADGNQVGWDGTGERALTYDLSNPATNVKVIVRGPSGDIVRTIESGGQGEGRQTATWDGKNDDGATVGAGLYTFEISAVDGSGENVAATTLLYGKIDRISFGPEGIKLWMGKVSLSMGAVTSVE